MKKLVEYNKGAIALILALALGGALTACSAGPAESGDPSSGEQSEVQGEGDDSEADDSEADDSDEIPAWVTDNFPIHPDSEVSTVSGTETITIGFMMNSGDGQAVIDWYNEQYNQNGWETDLVQNEGARFNAEHTDGYIAVVGVTSVSTATIVTLTAFNGG